MPTNIRAGEINEIKTSSGNWLILDIGFAKTGNKSCGLMINEEEPEELTFAKAKKKICCKICESKKPINLVIEAPLSVAFDKNGNPKGRKFEKEGAKTRYWYVGLGCAVMTASMYLIRTIYDRNFNTKVRLFEGFVSFKDQNEASDHCGDVKMLRNTIKSNQEKDSQFILDHNEKNENDKIKMDSSDILKSAFEVAGIEMHPAIPPVIVGQKKAD